MSGWWAKTVAAVGDTIGLDEESQANLANAGVNAVGTMADIASTVQATIAEKKADFDASEQAFAEAEQRRTEESSDAPHAGLLPWEAEVASKSNVAQELMERILELSLDEATFSPPPPPAADVFSFSLSSHTAVIMRLLALDSNLAKAGQGGLLCIEYGAVSCSRAVVRAVASRHTSA